MLPSSSWSAPRHFALLPRRPLDAVDNYPDEFLRMVATAVEDRDPFAVHEEIGAFVRSLRNLERDAAVGQCFPDCRRNPAHVHGAPPVGIRRRALSENDLRRVHERPATKPLR